MMTTDESLRQTQLGALAALSAYTSWGLFPLFFRLLGDVSPYIVVAHRVIWSAIMVAIFLLIANRLGEIKAVFKSKKSMVWLAASTIAISINWAIFVGAAGTENVLSVSFGYFMTPLVNVALGMLLLGERQNVFQAVAIGIAVIAVSVQAIGLGGVPWISLALAFSFAFYGYFRKTVDVGAAPGLLIETLMITPVALIMLAVLGPAYPMATPEAGLLIWFLLFMSGPLTAGPLILFSFGAKRLRMTTIGIFQYIAPSMHFVLAVWLLGEPLNEARLFSFVLIWVSLAIFTYDSYIRQRQVARDRKKVML
ncbi:EamA family transporter RarD [Maritalea mediterranea]|uniref:EamA family transporter RarD n=1 Tax=Maritalea mediterranea TaxID=2909667 RepID=A0ABS9E7U2_9HYPH|nr:EamA family transporter RarD [Maritalea mediterranea]MCF4098945.1 EamA family transporter RarD [Maritalea mediterranea]